MNNNLIKTPSGLIEVESKIRYVSSEEYSNLTDEQKNSGKYMVTDIDNPTTAKVINDIKTQLDNKSSNDHTHDDKYYGKLETDTKLSDVNNSISSHTSNINNPHNVTKDQIGLGNVDDTSDLDKPVSTATQTELDKINSNLNNHNSDTTVHITSTERTNWNAAKTHADSAHARTDATKVEKSSTNGNIKINDTETVVYTHPSGTNPHGTTKSDIGLGNVDNTSDLNKPVSTAQQTAINTAYANSNKYTDEKIADLINGAPSTLDTLGELAEAMKNNQDVVSALDTAIGTKANQSDLTSHTGNTTVHITSGERTNWNSAKTHADSAHAPSNAQANVIETIKVNGTALTPSSKAVNVTVPTKVSQLTNDSGFTTNTGTVTGVKVGSTSYSPSSGIVSLPAYPTSLPASDVYSWAKASSKPSYTASEVGLGNVGNFKAVSTVASQGLSSTEQANARANIGAGTSSFSGSYNDLSNKPSSLPASDVYSWAKASSKPSYTYSEVGAAAANHTHDYLPLSGGTLTGALISNNVVPYTADTYGLGTDDRPFGYVHVGKTLQFHANGYHVSISAASTLASTREYTFGNTSGGRIVIGGDGTEIGSPNAPVYINSEGKATMCKLSNNKSHYDGFPYVSSGGVLPIGRYINFYTSTGDTAEWRSRIATTTSAKITTTLPSVSGTLANASSDIRLKENIKDSNMNAINLIKKIKIREFDWKDLDDAGSLKKTHQKIGFIADELEELDDRLSIGGGFFEDTPDGEEPIMNVKTVDTFYLLGYVVKAMQELLEENESLKDRISTLENK